MEPSPASEANSASAGQYISRLDWNQKQWPATESYTVPAEFSAHTHTML